MRQYIYNGCFKQKCAIRTETCVDRKSVSKIKSYSRPPCCFVLDLTTWSKHGNDPLLRKLGEAERKGEKKRTPQLKNPALKSVKRKKYLLSTLSLFSFNTRIKFRISIFKKILKIVLTFNFICTQKKRNSIFNELFFFFNYFFSVKNPS